MLFTALSSLTLCLHTGLFLPASPSSSDLYLLFSYIVLRLDSLNCFKYPYLFSSPCIDSRNSCPPSPSVSSCFLHSYTPSKSAIGLMARKQLPTPPATARQGTHRPTHPHAATILSFHTVRTTISAHGTERCIEVPVRIKHGGVQTARSSAPNVRIPNPIRLFLQTSQKS